MSNSPTDPIRPSLEREWPCLGSRTPKRAQLCENCYHRAKVERVIGEILKPLAGLYDGGDCLTFALDPEQEGYEWRIEAIDDLIRLAREHAKGSES